TDGERRITDILTNVLGPERLIVKDISGGCGAMYAVQIASSKFIGLSLVKQHQMVVKAIDAEIKNAHGIQIKTELP
ncbi:bola protein, partial [Chytridium lagenaria]